jgi:uncharacterized protein
MASLFDVNALSALLDPAHAHHDRAHDLFDRAANESRISSPTTQHGVVRIVSYPKYSNAQVSSIVLESLNSLTLPG